MCVKFSSAEWDFEVKFRQQEITDQHWIDSMQITQFFAYIGQFQKFSMATKFEDFTVH